MAAPGRPAAGRTGADAGPLEAAALRPLLEADELLAGRYLLLAALPGPPGAPARRWHAEDQVLARAVLVTALPADEPCATAFLLAGARAGSVVSCTLPSVYDAAVQARPDRAPVAYVITEWVQGRRLPEVLADGPLPPAQVLALARQGARALVAAHAAGVVHGRLHPGNALLDDGGRLRLTDLATAGALRQLTPGLPGDDVRDLAALVYALVTARWPDRSTGQPARGLPPAPVDQSGSRSPRQVRAGVPHGMDEIVMRALEPQRRSGQPPLRTAVELLAALEAAGPAVGPRAAGSAAPRACSRLRRLAPWLAIGAYRTGGSGD